jgi:asparagine synthase (glutamine-hydrolysing)
MCGICGVVTHRTAPEDGGRVEAMVSALAHRGPDDSGMGGGGEAGGMGGALLGVTRLAIRGLGDGHQPFLDAESGVLAVVNGEVDNHRELRELLASRGRSVPATTDVAVVLPLYLEFGEEFVSKLTGAFAVAIWDPRRRRLLLARDRAGERPLFYARAADGWTFATEIAALAEDPALDLTPDPAALASYLRFGCFAAPLTPFREVKKVRPGHQVFLEDSGEQSTPYWRWPLGILEKEPPSLERFDALFREAVHGQTENDVPFGVFLSGGIDSSLVAAVARSIRPEAPIRAFTLRFSDASYDEGDVAARVAKRVGAEAVTVWVEPEHFPVELERLVRLVGEPLADPAWIPTALLARRAAEDVKVALVGEGSDELFGGYPTYIGAQAAGRYAGLPGWIKTPIRRMVEAWPPSDKKVTLSFLLKKFVAGAEMDGLERHALWVSALPPDLIRRLGPEPPAPDAERRESILDTVQLYDLEHSLAEGLLTKADRASMTSAVELRAPFLDRAVMEFAATLPESERVRGVTTKAFLKRFALRYLPRNVVHRKKRGLSVPLARWLREDLHDWAAERLGDPGLAATGIRPEAALALLQEHVERRADHARAIWALAVLAEWLAWARSTGRRDRERAPVPGAPGANGSRRGAGPTEAEISNYPLEFPTRPS